MENQIYLIKIGNAEINLKILYEDNHIIVVEKPVNIPSQGDKTGDIDMLAIVKQYIKEKYKNIMYLELMPEDKNNVPFYEKHGFHVMENGAAMQICNIN